MSRVIGAASDFYRLRVTRIDVSDEPELDWRDDILYRDPPPTVLEEEEDWRLEAVKLVDEHAVEIAQFTEQDQAEVLMAGVQEDLDSMTKSAFEEQYLSSPTPVTPDQSEDSAAE